MISYHAELLDEAATFREAPVEAQKTKRKRSSIEKAGASSQVNAKKRKQLLAMLGKLRDEGWVNASLTPLTLHLSGLSGILTFFVTILISTLSNATKDEGG
jgi:hypothetical protein